MRFILILILMAATVGCWETERGEKIGTIVKFSKEGFLIGTYEAELIKGGMSEGTGAFGKSFHFTVENRDLIEKVNELIKNQNEVRIKYHKEWFAMPWRCQSNNYFLDAIEIK